jgi:hypothetical protein
LLQWVVARAAVPEDDREAAPALGEVGSRLGFASEHAVRRAVEELESLQLVYRLPRAGQAGELGLIVERVEAWAAGSLEFAPAGQPVRDPDGYPSEIQTGTRPGSGRGSSGIETGVVRDPDGSRARGISSSTTSTASSAAAVSPAVFDRDYRAAVRAVARTIGTLKPAHRDALRGHMLAGVPLAAVEAHVAQATRTALSWGWWDEVLTSWRDARSREAEADAAAWDGLDEAGRAVSDIRAHPGWQDWRATC